MKAIRTSFALPCSSCRLATSLFEICHEIIVVAGLIVALVDVASSSKERTSEPESPAIFFFSDEVDATSYPTVALNSVAFLHNSARQQNPRESQIILVFKSITVTVTLNDILSLLSGRVIIYGLLLTGSQNRIQNSLDIILLGIFHSAHFNFNGKKVYFLLFKSLP